MSNLTEPVSDLKLERFVAGDLPEKERERIRLQAEGDELLQARIDALRKSNDEILAEIPPEIAALRIAAKLDDARVPSSPDTFRAHWKWALPALSAVAAALFLMVNDSAIREPEWTGIKGLQPHLLLYRESAEGPERLENENKAAEGDHIQIVYNSVGRSYGLIFSIDGNGAVTRHLPDQPGPAGRLRSNRPDTLQFAYRLDDAPRRERFYFISGSEPFASADIIEKARHDTSAAAEPLLISAALSQHVITLIKE